jgi:hypothetical protein
MNTYYVYALLDPRYADRPFYIGKGMGDRLNDHFKDRFSTTTNPRRRRIIHECRRKGLVVKAVKLHENLTSYEAYVIEEGLIKLYGRFGYDKGGILMNIRTSARPPANSKKEA